jgi:hypothetical protein
MFKRQRRKVYVLAVACVAGIGDSWVDAGPSEGKRVCSVTDAPLAEDSLGIACTVDEDCANESICIDGVCYVPKNRFVSFRPGNAGTSVAFFVHSPGCPDQDQWVGAPALDVSCRCSDPDGTICDGVAFISRLQTTPY